MLLTLDECIEMRPCQLVYIGTESELVQNFESCSQVEHLEEIQVAIVSTDKEALASSLNAKSSPQLYVFGLFSFLESQKSSMTRMLYLASAFAATGAKFAEPDDFDRSVLNAYLREPSGSASSSYSDS